MTTINIFEQASRKGLRFDTSKGQNSASVEDLWNLPLTSGGDLDKIAKALKKSLDNSDDDSSFVKPVTTTNALTVLKFEIVKYVIDTRLAERDAATLASAKAESKRNIQAIIARKQAGALEDLSIEELQKLADQA